MSVFYSKIYIFATYLTDYKYVKNKNLKNNKNILLGKKEWKKCHFEKKTLTNLNYPKIQ